MKNVFSFSGVFITSLMIWSLISISAYGTGGILGEHALAADINLNVDNDGVVRDSSGKILKGTKIDIPQKSTAPEGIIDTEKKVPTEAVVDTVAKEDVKSVIANENTAALTAVNIQKKLDTRYRVEKVELVKANTPDKKDMIRFSGKAVPNTIVTLYIYSTPTIVVVTADAEGNWSYDMTQGLPNGDHEVYVAVTDATGKVSSYSEGIAFIKTAEAITVKPIAEAADGVVSNQSPLERSQMEYIIVAFISVLVFFGIALIVVGRHPSK